jgi:hypothetical protein
VLYMGAHAIRTKVQLAKANDEEEGAGRELFYTLSVVQNEPRPTTVKLKLVSGPGDDGAPVLTIMLPEED